MHQVTSSRTVNNSPAAVWEALAAFNQIAEWNPNIVSSPGTGREDFGVGAKRVCTFNDGNSMVETVTKLETGRSMTLELSEFNMPMHSAHVDFQIHPEAEGANVMMQMSFAPKYGPLGALLASLLIKPMMKKVMGQLLEALEGSISKQAA
jgi:carbon monoxide dehydrogenase subunit G